MSHCSHCCYDQDDPAMPECKGCGHEAELTTLRNIVMERDRNIKLLEEADVEIAALRAALVVFTPHGMADVRALWANGEVCKECSHSLCERFREAQESALGNLAKYLRFAKALADAHAALAVAEEMADFLEQWHMPGCALDCSSRASASAEAPMGYPCDCGHEQVEEIVTRYHVARRVGK